MPSLQNLRGFLVFIAMDGVPLHSFGEGGSLGGSQLLRASGSQLMGMGS